MQVLAANTSRTITSMQQQHGFVPKEVSPAQSIVSGLAAFLAGAAAAGGAHYSVTAKKLQEDGIDPRLRMKAMPIAVSVLLSAAGTTVRKCTSALPGALPLIYAWAKLCLQLRALALSTLACGTIGALGYMAVKHSGLQMKDTAAVSSLHDAIGLAQQQRVSRCLPACLCQAPFSRC